MRLPVDIISMDTALNISLTQNPEYFLYNPPSINIKNRFVVNKNESRQNKFYTSYLSEIKYIVSYIN